MIIILPLPRFYEPGVQDRGKMEFRRVLKILKTLLYRTLDICGEQGKNIILVDVTEKLMGIKEHFARDGVHLSLMGKEIVLKEIERWGVTNEKYGLNPRL